MFKGYRDLLKVLCEEEWCTDYKKLQVDKFLFGLTKDGELGTERVVLIDLVKAVCNLAFKKVDKDLLYLSLNTIICLDEALDKKQLENKGKQPIKKIEGEDEKGYIEAGKDELLRKEYEVKKEAINYVIERIPKTFSVDNVYDHLLEYYRTILNSTNKESTIRVYSGHYVKYLVAARMATKDELEGPVPHERSVKSYHLVNGIKPAKAPEQISRSKLSKYAQYILLWSEKNGTDLIDMRTMLDHRLDGATSTGYRARDIKSGMNELVGLGIATSLGRNKYGLKKERIK